MNLRFAMFPHRSWWSREFACMGGSQHVVLSNISSHANKNTLEALLGYL